VAPGVDEHLVGRGGGESGAQPGDVAVDGPSADLTAPDAARELVAAEDPHRVAGELDEQLEENVSLAVYFREYWRLQALPHLEKGTRQNYERAWLKWIKPTWVIGR
jgi:hypothetical protein